MHRRKRLSRRRGVYLVLLLFAATMAGSYLAAGGKGAPAPPVSPSLEQPDVIDRVLDSTGIVLKQRFKLCGHEYTWLGGDLPEEFALINFTGMSHDELEEALPGHWRLLEFSPRQVVLEQVGEICTICFNKGYIGVHNDRIAIFRGVPPSGSLERVTEFEVKNDVRDQLEKGIPFSNMEELLLLLESYTS
jgi:hypothetical protein